VGWVGYAAGAGVSSVLQSHGVQSGAIGATGGQVVGQMVTKVATKGKA